MQYSALEPRGRCPCQAHTKATPVSWPVAAATATLALILLCSSCEVLPEIHFTARDAEGRPLPRVSVTVSTSEPTELIGFPEDSAPAQSQGASDTCRHRLEGTTDATGTFEAALCLPSQPGFFARLFGAERVPLQRVSLEYEDASGNQYTCVVEVIPR